MYWDYMLAIKPHWASDAAKRKWNMLGPLTCEIIQKRTFTSTPFRLEECEFSKRYRSSFFPPKAYYECRKGHLKIFTREIDLDGKILEAQSYRGLRLGFGRMIWEDGTHFEFMSYNVRDTSYRDCWCYD